MSFIIFLIFVTAVYISFSVGKIVGRTQALLGNGETKRKKRNTDNIEEAEYEEVK